MIVNVTASGEHSTIETAPKLDNFYNSVDSSAIPDMVAKYFPSSQKTEEYRLTHTLRKCQLTEA